MADLTPSEEMAAASRMLAARDDALVEEDFFARRLERDTLTSAQRKAAKARVVKAQGTRHAAETTVRETLKRLEKP